MNDNSYKVIEADINEILPNRFQPRIQFDEEEILELSDSIKEHGVIQPIVVRTIGDKYEIIAGERRYKASVLAGKETVPVIIKNLNDKESAEIALIENIQRKNLTPIEEALSYKKILDMGYLTQEKLAVKLGKSQSSIANKIRLLNLSDEVQEALLENKISERHARSLLKLKDIIKQNRMLEKIIQERLTVRKTDEEISKVLNSQEDDDDSNNEEKIIEKGDKFMNQANNNFDIFGSIPNIPVNDTPVVPSVPVVEPSAPSMPSMPAVEPAAPAMPSVPVIEPAAPVMPSVPVVEPAAPAMPSVPVIEPAAPVMPSMPAVEPAAPVMPSVPVIEPAAPAMPSMPVVEPAAPVMPSMPVVEMVEPVVPSVPEVEPAQPTITGGYQFDENGILIANEPVVEPAAPVVPSVPDVETITPSIPEMAPIIEKPIEEPTINVEESIQIPAPVVTQPNMDTVTINEENKPEPIIVTDYSKQYDPVMPNYNPEPVSKVDFKEIISAIRECSEKIEKYGYKIDLEEYDLSTIYQVVLKIEK